MFEFSLFSSSTGPSVIELPREPAKSILALDDGIPQAPKVVINKRPDSYYFVDDSDETRLHKTQSCAISGADIIAQSMMPWPGMQMPWRVINISTPVLAKKRKANPNKKRRFALREKAARVEKLRGSAKSFKGNYLGNWKFYNLHPKSVPSAKKKLKSAEDDKPKTVKPSKTILS
ncbi:uncharacterized protein V1518DRAFT_436382 [Limtongia smithiae]|uniref:uncharacterized protein n=1 Tax=Limtongia smithiae TaxID=1125753 RepID=UPI0034CF091C